MNSFLEKGYVHVPGLFDKETAFLMSEYFENKLARGEIQTDQGKIFDEDHTAINYYADPLVEVLLKKATPFVSKEVGEELAPTYSFFRIYRAGEKLSKHTDRSACEISVTVAVAFVGKPNKIYMQARNQKENSFTLSPGDGVIYKGCEIVHWREALEDEQMVIQFMLHYVKKNGPHANLIFDERPRLGAKTCQ
jgi:hypothetical protein